MIEQFTYDVLPVRVLFGKGTVSQLADEIKRLGHKRALVLATPQQEEHGHRIVTQLGDLAVGVYAGAVMHTPSEVTDNAATYMAKLEADCVVSLGGGSTTGLGKALALRTGVDQVCIPTTYAGSEMTPILGETKDGLKTTIRSADVLPETVIYDVDLTMTLPPGLSAVSGMNAIAHSVEALYARDRNPIISLMAQESIRALASALPKIATNPSDVEGRTDALYGAWLAGICLGSVGMALHHKLCHTLGGSFDLPHAETHTIVLPHAVAYNAPAAPAAMEAICQALGVTDAALGLYALTTRLGVPQALSQIGMPEDGIDKAAQIAMNNAYWNPQPLELDGITDLIRGAYLGQPPQAA